jgi:hypothetical protein
MEKYIITIQKWFRGYIYRLKHLPLILYKIKNYLLLQNLLLSNIHEDGRINSSIDENIIIDIIIKKFGDRIKIPKIRMWYDILHRPKRKMRQDYLFLYILKLCFK